MEGGAGDILIGRGDTEGVVGELVRPGKWWGSGGIGVFVVAVTGAVVVVVTVV